MTVLDSKASYTPVSAARFPSSLDANVSRNGKICVASITGRPSNEIIVLSKAVPELRLSFQDYAHAYQPAVSADGNLLAVVVQNVKQKNVIVVVDLTLKKVIDKMERDGDFYLFPNFDLNELSFLRSQIAAEITFKSRGLSELYGKDDVFRLMAKNEEASRLDILEPKFFGKIGPEDLVCESNLDPFSNRNIQSNVMAVSSADIFSREKLFVTPSKTPFRIVWHSEIATYFADSDDNIYKLSSEFKNIIDVYKRTEFALFQYNFRNKFQHAKIFNSKCDLVFDGRAFGNFIRSFDGGMLFGNLQSPSSGRLSTVSVEGSLSDHFDYGADDYQSIIL